MTREEQLNLWVEGTSAHNKEEGECCPDFSCCQKLFSFPREDREKFKRAYLEKDQATINRLLLASLEGTFAAHHPDVEIITSAPESEKSL